MCPEELWLNGAVKCLGIAIMLLGLVFCPPRIHAQRNARESQPVPMRHPPADPDTPRWHSIKVHPKAGLPQIHFYDKLNPVWWLGNSDEPKPPESYLPDKQFRETRWFFRNPFHNFSYYLIGVSDKDFIRSGKFPDRNSDPRGGWNFAVCRRHVLLLPFISYDQDRLEFYFGWRERGNFGIKLNFHRQQISKHGAHSDLDAAAIQKP